MKSILDHVTARQYDGNPECGATSTPPEAFRRSVRRAAFGVQLQSLPLADQERSSACAQRLATPAPGLAGVSQSQISISLEEANREWFIWRFGDDDV